MKRENFTGLLSRVLVLCGVVLSGCTPEMSQMGSSFLAQTGVMSSSQADSLFKVGAKLSKAAESVSDEQEYYLGRSVSAVILSRYPALPNQSLALYSSKVAGVLASYSTRPEIFGGYHVGVLNSDEVNAVSAPGGFIFISRGFLKLLENEDELAAVIAHEIAHVALKHGTSAISESNLTDALQIAGKEAAASSGNSYITELNAAFSDSVNQVAKSLLDKGYGKSQEYAADEYAVALLKRSGYDARALVTVLQKLEKVSKQDGGWFETHPSAEKRIDEIGGSIGVASVSPDGLKKREQRFKKVKF